MTKYFKILLIVFSTCILSGCNLSTSQYIIPNNKPNNNYYSSKLYSNLINNSPYTLKIFDMDVYTYYDVDEDEPDILLGFLQSLKNDNYVTEVDSTLKIRYKLIIEFTEEKFIINIFNKNTISLHPWDGVYNEDFISYDNISPYYNLYDFCEYIEKKTKGLD